MLSASAILLFGAIGIFTSNVQIAEAQSDLPESCGVYLRDYLRMGAQNDPDQVKKLQAFLNDTIDSDLEIDGIFGVKTEVAVRQLQMKYRDEILKPWEDAGFGDLAPTGYVYITTRHFINVSKCKDLDVVRPPLVPDVAVSNTTFVAAVASTDTEVSVVDSDDNNDETCGIYLHDYLRFGGDNDVDEVKKLQKFLNEFQDADLSVNGEFDEDTLKAVKEFQSENAEEILAPWVKAGRLDTLDAAGFVYKTTQHFINKHECPNLPLALPIN